MQELNNIYLGQSSTYKTSLKELYNETVVNSIKFEHVNVKYGIIKAYNLKGM